MGRPNAELVLTDDGRATLAQRARRRMSPQATALWCRIVLGSATGTLESTALCLRVEGAEGEGGLARSGHPGERDQRVPRDVHIDGAEVVLTSAAHPYGRVGHPSMVGHRQRLSGEVSQPTAVVAPICSRASSQGSGVAMTARSARTWRGESPAASTPMALPSRP